MENETGTQERTGSDGSKAGGVRAKATLMRIVERARGDDLERAEHAFAGLSQDQLNEEWGQSGRTKGELLERYRQQRREWQAAYDLAKSVCQ